MQKKLEQRKGQGRGHMMACLNMLSNEQQAAAMGPRISFSNDFADSQHPMMSYKEAPVSSDNFEFSVSGYNMISADQVFCKGKLMPLKEDRSCSNTTTTTLRDELLQANDNDNDDLFPRFPKGIMSSRWRERLGLKRSHIFPRKTADKNLQRIDETKVAAHLI